MQLEATMLYFLFFLLGALVHKLLSILLAANEAYRIYKLAEAYSMLLVLETEVWRKQALAILEITYNDIDQPDAYNNIQIAVNKKFSDTQQSIIALIRNIVPYDIGYNNLQEAEKIIKEQLLKLKGEFHE